MADTGATAATDAVAGLLSRAFASASVRAEPWARDAITPVWLGQVGRDLVRNGKHLSAIVVGDLIAPDTCAF